MLKRHNKAVLLTLTASLSVTSLVACSSKNETPAGGAAPASPAPAATANEPKPQLKSLQIWQKDDYNTYPVAKYLEQKTGYKVQYDMLPQDKAADKLNILIASGEPYDAVTTGGGTDFKALFADYAKKGALTDLGPLIDKYGPNIKAAVDPAVLEAAKVDGKLYAIPTKTISFASESLYIRQDWLEKVGMKTPTTLDELVAVLKAFKEKDPGGNGDKNIPLTIRGDAMFISNIVGAFGMTTFWNDVNGKLTPRVLDPAYKDYVTFANDLFKQGLLDKEFAANKDATAKEKFSSGRAGMIMLHWADVPAVNDALVKNNPNAKAGFIPALKGKDGKAGLNAAAGFDRITFIPKASKHPEDAIKWMNAKLEPETFKTMAIGEENKHYTLKDGAYLPIQPIFTDERNQANNFLMGTDDKNYPTYWQARVRKDPRLFEAWNFMNTVEPASTRIKDPLGLAPYLPEFSKNFQQLNTMVGDYTTKLIFGAEPISGIEAFQAKFKAAGGDASYKEVNDWYATVKK
ncbi:putative aldouronate transport system substrate-binding protein [Paenibacillus sp. UNCCL117]|uniref:extracellular solute-binding protein n=1 Tax=unclassified Paenibacillus TaxID=185978 RepID=UPI00087F3764|nr:MULTISPECIES: extracellular solute-binding protein [unclassified Paenibacillus]SDC16399.1 putative aldouronate transport system substrate-binding protein [Paenibacillus sp. cl123]SFW17770.1 putative aldouronate transport system substrate-binding protein [Paenibacillus sp. UNCCL117]